MVRNESGVANGVAFIPYFNDVLKEGIDLKVKGSETVINLINT